MIRRSLFAAVVAACLISPLSAIAGDAATKPMAVLFNADWCLNCKLMRPRLEPLRAEYADRVDFLVADYTTDEGRAQGKALARERGFAPIYNANRATGWVALLNPDGSQAGSLTVKMDEAQLRQALDALLARRPSPSAISGGEQMVSTRR